MKIAVAVEERKVSDHFGHCEGFHIFKVENGQILDNQLIPNPGHRPGFLPRFLKENNVDVIIAGGMGEMAQRLFQEREIEVVVGAKGVSEEVVNEYLKGKLKSTGSVCKEHNHSDSCGSH